MNMFKRIAKWFSGDCNHVYVNVSSTKRHWTIPKCYKCGGLGKLQFNG